MALSLSILLDTQECEDAKLRASLVATKWLPWLFLTSVLFGCGDTVNHEQPRAALSELNQSLFLEYEELSDRLRDKKLFSRSRLFERKANAAARNEDVLPESPSNYSNLARSNVVLYARARQALLSELGFVEPSCSPNELAYAQVQLDCHIALNGLLISSSAFKEICVAKLPVLKC